MKKLLLTSAVLLSVVGCASNPATVHNAALLDSASTLYAINRGGAEEQHPILGDNAAEAAVKSYLIKMGVTYGARKFASKERCVQVYKAVTGFGFGFGGTANNLGVASGMDLSEHVATGVTAGIFAFKNSAGNAERFCSK